MKYLLFLALVISLASCGSYSPLDTHVNGVIASDSLNRVSEAQARQYIDSLNNKNK